MIPIFNEHQFAIDMNNGCSDTREQDEKRHYNFAELTVYTKWLYWNIFVNKPDDERYELTKCALINFCKQLLSNFNENNDYNLIEHLLSKAQNEKLRTNYPINITTKEWQQIMGLPNENARKLYFAMLVLAKYNRANPIEYLNQQHKEYADCRYRISNVKYKELCKYANIKITKKEKEFDDKAEERPIQILENYNLIKVLKYYKGKKRKIQTTFLLLDADVDNESDIYLKITDCNNIDSYYEYGMHNLKYKKCEKCDNIFKSRSAKNNDKYCAECAGLHSLPFYYKICVDCGRRIRVNNLYGKVIRCKQCQYEHKLLLKRNAYMMNGAQLRK